MRCGFPREGTFGVQYPCGKCQPCRINRARQKAARLMLEARAHPYTAFVTLTYDEDNVPVHYDHDTGEVQLTLDKKHLQDFLKRARYHYGKFRFAAVGEYGTETQRPHYHLCMYGLDPVRLQYEDHCHDKVWGKGNVDVGLATADGFRYISGYVVKGMQNANDEYVQDWLKGRTPEFFRQSLKPAIGVGAVPELASIYQTSAGAHELARYHDIEHTFRLDGEVHPFDYHMKTKLREHLGIPPLAKDRLVLRKFDPAQIQTPDEIKQSQKRHQKVLRNAKKKAAERATAI